MRSKKTYLDGNERFVRFHMLRHLAIMGAPELEAFLPYLAVNEEVSAST
ncbi:MAG: phage integrase N-terminal SAM-like domain-containing protein [Candidatus Oleimicrobiaceae bacterium]